MIKKLNNKGAIEMSLNLIIMLIIGMVVLGLVIGFVNSLVNKGTESFDKELGDNEKLKLDEVKNCPDVFCINPNPSISIAKGAKQNVFIKVRNVGLSDDIKIAPGPVISGALMQGSVYDDLGGEFVAIDVFTLSGPGFLGSDGDGMNAGEEQAQMYTLTVGDTTIPGTYYVPFGVKIGTVDYKKIITVEVK